MRRGAAVIAALHRNASPVTRIRSSATNVGDATKECIRMSVEPQHKRLTRHAPGATVVGARAWIAADSDIPVGASQQTGPPCWSRRAAPATR